MVIRGKNRMKTVAFVPIKMNSQRLKDKNILPFGLEGKKKPLLTYIFDILLNTQLIDEVYCYCSDESIAHYLPNGVSFFKRDAYLDGHKVSSNELLYYFANDVWANNYVLTHATNPLIKSETIDRVVNAVMGEKHDSAMTVKKIQDLMWINGKPNFDPSNAPLTQDITPIFQETYGAICLERDLIVGEKRRAGYNPAFIEVSEFEAVDINTKEDFLFAEAIYQYIHRGQ